MDSLLTECDRLHPNSPIRISIGKTTHCVTKIHRIELFHGELARSYDLSIASDGGEY
jgi:hypothetical protein